MDSVNTTPRDASLADKLQLCAQKKVYLLVDKQRFLQIPEQLRGYATNATEELIREVAFVFESKDRPVYLFTSETNFYAGSIKLQKEANGRVLEFTTIVVSPEIVFRVAGSSEPQFVIDYGQPDEFSMPPDALHGVFDLIVVAKIAKLDSIPVLVLPNGDAASLEVEGKHYAVGFLHPQDATVLMRELSKTMGKCRLEDNAPRALARNLLKSEFHGIIIGPGSAVETILDRNELEILAASGGSSSGSGVWSSVRGLFSRVPAQ